MTKTEILPHNDNSIPLKEQIKTKAILFGINYKNTENELEGPSNDIENMKIFLKNKGFQDICIYNEDNIENVCKNGILQILKNLVKETYENNLDLVWIHWSGHGTNIDCVEGDERDGKDECLVPLDFKTNGFITDDTLSDIIHQINPKTKVIFMCDSCHSGTILDLHYHYLLNNQKHIDNNRPVTDLKILCISGCLDTQTSADAFNIYNSSKYTGALTSCFLEVMKYAPYCNDNIFMLINELHQTLKKNSFDQVPQLTSTYKIEYEPSFLPNIL